MFLQPSTNNWKAEADKAAYKGFQPPQDAGRLVDFVKGGWHVIDPGMPLIWNWHLDALCEHLEAVANGEIQNLVINIPPGHAKSNVVGVLWPAWMWIRRPEWRALFSSYDLSLVTRDATRTRDVIDSEWYQAQYCPIWKLRPDQNTKTFFKNTRQGFRFCHTVAGRGTGHRGDAIVVDDPQNARTRHSVKKREAMLDWWKRTMPTRLNDPRIGVKVIIMQRLHEEDLTAEVLKANNYTHLCLMSRFDPERKTTTSVMRGGEKVKLWEDPRTQRDELLFPQLFTPQVLDDLQAELGDEDFEAQHQQNPMPAEGGMFKERYWKFWCYPGQKGKLPPVRVKLETGEYLEIEAEELPSSFDRQVQSWDLTFKAKKSSDYVVGQVWGVVRANRYLLHQFRERAGFDDSVAALLKVSEAWPQARTKYVEDKANGSAIIDHLKAKLSGLTPVEPRGDKEERAWAVVPQIRSGNVYLPHPQIAAWVGPYIDEFKGFPNGVKDDQVDATSQALDQLDNDKPAAAPVAVAVASPLYNIHPHLR